jgi:hypothetical protein
MLRLIPDSLRKAIALALLLGFAPVASGCFGSFNLTRKLYAFNKSSTPNKWFRWGLFLGMNVFPVYWFGLLGDAFFANAFEFWSGSNPITVRIEPKTVVGPDGGVAQLVPVTGGARIVITEASGAVHEVTLLREAPGVLTVYDRDGTLVRKLVGVGSDDPRIVEIAEAR